MVTPTVRTRDRSGCCCLGALLCSGACSAGILAAFFSHPRLSFLGAVAVLGAIFVWWFIGELLAIGRAPWRA